jgi:hypothetical protein
MAFHTWTRIMSGKIKNILEDPISTIAFQGKILPSSRPVQLGTLKT